MLPPLYTPTHCPHWVQVKGGVLAPPLSLQADFILSSLSFLSCKVGLSTVLPHGCHVRHASWKEHMGGFLVLLPEAQGCPASPTINPHPLQRP